MNTASLQQLSLPFEGDRSFDGTKARLNASLSPGVVAKAMATTAILRATKAAKRQARVQQRLSPEIALFAQAMPQEALRDAWWAIEDLLARLARLARSGCLSIAQAEPAQVIVGRVQSLEASDQAELLEALLDPATFVVRAQGRAWSFTRWVERRGDEVVVQFIDPARIRAWIGSADGGRGLSGLLPFVQRR